MALFLVGIAVK